MKRLRRNLVLALAAAVFLILATPGGDAVVEVRASQSYAFFVSAGDSAWVYCADYQVPGSSHWDGPHVINFSVGVSLVPDGWHGLFTYEANASAYQDSFYLCWTTP